MLLSSNRNLTSLLSPSHPSKHQLLLSNRIRMSRTITASHQADRLIMVMGVVMPTMVRTRTRIKVKARTSSSTTLGLQVRMQDGAMLDKEVE
jgi:hypothetical protein